MTTRTTQSSPQLNARVAGILYLALVPLSFFGMMVASGIVVPGNTAATVSHILAAELQFRLGIVTTLLIQIVNIFVVLALYRLLKPVNREMAFLMVIFLLLGAPIAMLNELNQFAVLAIVRNSASLTGFTAEQLQALVSLLVNLHQQGINIASIFWGLWLFPMGYLVFKSGFLPKILGILLVIGGIGYLVQSFAAFLLPSFTVNLALFTFWGEVLFPLWLLIKGVNIAAWKRWALESA